MIKGFKIPLEANHNDMIGKTFGRLTVISGNGLRNSCGKFMYMCRCECGNEKLIVGASLRNGNTQSCGCLYKESRGTMSTTHGQSGSPEHASWKAMWSRCTNPNNQDYEFYKDKCPPDTWKDFEVFLKDMGPKPSPKHSIERENNNLPYSPGNCTWANANQQARNKGNTVRVLFNERPLSMADACDAADINYHQVAQRYYRNKDIEAASNGLFKQVTQNVHNNIL
jgi:hypothetical protein